MKSGVYFLLLRNKVVYIGKSKNVFNRVLYQLTTKRIKFNSYRIILCRKSKIDYYERRWIERFKPACNVSMNDKYKKRINDSFIIKYNNLIQSIIETKCNSESSKLFALLMQSARAELNYAPMTENSQIWQGIEGHYSKYKSEKKDV